MGGRTPNREIIKFNGGKLLDETLLPPRELTTEQKYIDLLAAVRAYMSSPNSQTKTKVLRLIR